jgi:hypothetical protein
MPTVTYNYESQHTFVYQGGLVLPKPALTNGSRLYVIQNDSTTHNIYVGTALHVNDRFGPRATVCRELGFSQIDMDDIKIFVVQISIDGVAATPGDTGVSTAAGYSIDVEWLLIRTYVEELHLSVRNINKLSQFHNGLATRINWNLVDNAGIGFGGHNYYLNAGFFL